MADAATVTGLINYYVNLLIIQYHNKPKAMATINLLAKELLANGVLIDILNGFNINPALGPTAVGKQLDVIGKYVGVDRLFRETDLINFFAFTFYADVDPDDQQKFGFSDYANFSDLPNIGNGTLTYSSLISMNNQLLDDAFLTLIQLAIRNNNMNYSVGAIDSILNDLFGSTIRAESFGNMHMFFFVSESPTDLIKAIIYKGLLPVPMGVGAVVATNMKPLTFGMTDYAGYTTPFEYGFAQYSNFDSLAGAEITYDQISGE